MPFAIVTGGPGAGKTTLLASLQAKGYPIVGDTARALIAERKRDGLAPRPEPLAFAREILNRDAAKYAEARPLPGWVFFDRGALDAIGLLHETSAIAAADLDALRTRFAVDHVFVLPPWEAIYATDAERDQSFADAVAIHARVVRWYEQLGYAPTEVPRDTAEARTAFVLRTLGIASF
jgi:predicted ATPase